MSDFLEQIMKLKREEVEQAKLEVGEIELRARCGGREDFRSFYAALKNPGVNIIAEIKRASPSKGDIQPDLDAAKMASVYEAGGASCVSVLTEKNFFKGTLEDMIDARAACNLPVLRKDFIYDPYQIYEACAAGADAVLLIARILEKEMLEELLALTHALNIDALVEVHEEADLEKIDGIGARIVGINNRDLKSFDTDLDIALKMAQKLEPEQVAVAASGIFSRADIEPYLPADVHCFLVGESIVRASDSEAFIKELCGRDK